MKKIILLALIVVSFSCKNKEKQTPKEEPKKEAEVKKPEKFIIEATFKLEKSDDFRLFANGIFVNNTRTMNLSITEEVTRSENTQTLIFDLPEGVRPDYEVGINLGSKERKRIEFLEVKISYGDIEFIATPDKISDLFYLNEYINYTPENGVFQTQDANGKHNPIMYLKKDIVDQLNF